MGGTRSSAMAGLAAALLRLAAAGNDGIQSTPPMGAPSAPLCPLLPCLPPTPHPSHPRAPGWSTWYATGGNLSEAVVLDIADRMVKTGLRDAGYTFVRRLPAPLSSEPAAAASATDTRPLLPPADQP